MEQQELIRERSAEVERETVPMPVAPAQEVGPVSDVEALKAEVNDSFENLVDWINDTLKDKIIVVERTGRLNDEELKRFAKHLLSDARVETIYDLLAELQERISAIDKKLNQLTRRMYD
jgi:hypothetical protein